MLKPEHSHRSSKVIWVDFRRGRLSIDDDLYLKNVAEIHCRQCKHRKPREGASELTNTWGYICTDCKNQTLPSHHLSPISNERITMSKRSLQAEQSG